MANRKKANPAGNNDNQGGLLIDAYRRQSANLTRVKGNRNVDDMDEVSRKNLAANPKGAPRRGADMPPGGEYEYPVEMLQHASGTSIFDPVLCELIYTWFCPPGGKILDPFAGGSVRGIVAAVLGRHYTGIDLRAEQIEANYQQAEIITPDNIPSWIVGDSLECIPEEKFDLIFSCPPYGDLEIYSDNPKDLSTMDYPDFLVNYCEIIKKSVGVLNDNRFCCFTVGEIRDKKGFYRNFVGDTIAAFEEAGAIYYNEAILLTAIGSLPIRVGKQFQSARKLGKTHQNVLVFCKGDPKKATADIGEVEIWSGESLEGAD